MNRAEFDCASPIINIPFNEVALAAGDTIIFTSVLITFRTDAFPID